MKRSIRKQVGKNVDRLDKAYSALALAVLGFFVLVSLCYGAFLLIVSLLTWR